jgi:ABC-type glutathione transport system ATPase component
MAAMVRQLLRVTGLRVKYRGREAPAVDGLTFGVDEGEVVGLFGPSGCGKTTTALSVLNVLGKGAQMEGVLEFRGRDLRRMTGREWEAVRGASISMLFQSPRAYLNPVLTVRRQLEEVLRAHGRTGEGAGALIEQAGLRRNGVEKAFPHQLSGGECQRVALAKALACGPALLIADEPAVMLDLPVQLEIAELLEDMRARRKLSILLISHQGWLMRKLADRVIVMEAGRKVAEGLPGEVLKV